MAPTASKDVVDKDIIVRKRCWNAKSRRWGEWEILLRRCQVVSDIVGVAGRTRSRKRLMNPSNCIPLPLGGTIHIYPNLLDMQEQDALTKELIIDNAHNFRQYSIQGGPEPRAHWLLHEQATNQDFETSIQPGYKYGTITMKAKPLNMLPRLHKLAKDMATLCKVDTWNVGVNPVYYRDSRDYIGLHADNDQGEDKIMTILVKSPTPPRRVIVQTSPATKGTKKKQEGDEQYELNIDAGDAYDMDSYMQQHYVHGVPSGGKDGRIALVFRHGQFCKFSKDSGTALPNVEPRIVIPQTFGQLEGLNEGQLYSRMELRQLGAHCSPQGGISGNKMNGCDAIIMSDSRKDGLGQDWFDKVMYAAETRVGAAAILTSMATAEPIRVFRSSAAVENPYRAICGPKQPTQYRYDGLYRVSLVSFWNENGIGMQETPDEVSPPAVGRIYQFQLERKTVGSGNDFNRLSKKQLVDYSICKNTIGADARAALIRHETFDWPLPIMQVSPSQPAQIVDTSQTTSIGAACSQPLEQPVLREHAPCLPVRLNDYLRGNIGDGLARFYGLFPTPGFPSVAARRVSPTMSEASQYYSVPFFSDPTCNEEPRQLVARKEATSAFTQVAAGASHGFTFFDHTISESVQGCLFSDWSTELPRMVQGESRRFATEDCWQVEPRPTDYCWQVEHRPIDYSRSTRSTIASSTSTRGNTFLPEYLFP